MERTKLMKRLKHRKIWAAALSLSLLAVSCGGGGGSSASSSQSQSVSSQAEETPLAEAFGPGALGIGGGYWRYLMGHLSGGGYLSGVRVQRCSVRLGRVEITPKGIEYLLESPLMEKAAEALRPSGALGA